MANKGSNNLRNMITTAAKRTGISPALLAALVEAESSGNPNAKSSAGAEGLTQLMPATAAGLGVRNPFDPMQNLMGGAKYLKGQLQRFGGSEKLALAAYNAGPNAVARAGNKVPKIPETQAYVTKVLQLEESYKSSGLSDITTFDSNNIPVPAGITPGQAPFKADQTMSLLTQLLQPSDIAKSIMGKVGPLAENTAAASDNHLLLNMLQTQIDQAGADTSQATDNTNTTAADVTAPSSEGNTVIQDSNKLTQTALTQLNVPYQYGGNDWGKALDCSSLVQQTLARNGVNVGRTTYQQWKQGVEVNSNSLKPGDVVFFHKNAQGLPEHEGMYLGNDQFIEAPHTGDRVKIAQLSTYGGFMGARRYS